MSKIVVMEVDELTEIITNAMVKVLQDALPDIIERATRKPYLTREELMDLTGWSSPTIFHLRKTRQIPFVQHGRKILYPTNEMYAFFEEHKIRRRK